MATRLAVTVAVDASSAGIEADGRRREVNYTTELKALRTEVQNYPSSKHTHAAVWEPRWENFSYFLRVSVHKRATEGHSLTLASPTLDFFFVLINQR